MMSSNSQLPLLILSNSIYAKLADGGFYPGSIQAKHANSYVVKFPDGTEELVPEQHLTWLGFWGLPPWNWPKNPVILATPSCSEAIGGQTMAIRDNACPKNSMFVDSCTQQKTDRTHVPSQSNDPRHLNANDCPGERICLPSHVLPPHTDSSQPRSSVLRMNSNMLSKEGRVEHSDYSIGLPRDQSNSANKSHHSLPQSTRTYYKEKQTDSLLYEKFTPFAAEETNKIPDDRRSTTRGQQDCEKSLQKDLEDDSAKRNRSFFDEVNTTHLIKEGEQDLSLTTSDSRSEYRIPSSEGYPQSPTVSNIFTPQHPFLCEPFGMTILAAPQHLASFRIQTRSRRKLEKKKCRKVYGVENKHFWCTQCKWKKACTRFSHRFMTNGVV